MGSTVLSNGTKPGTFLLVAQDVGYLYDVPAVAAQGCRAWRHRHRKHPPEGRVGGVPRSDHRADSYVVEAPVVGKTFDINVASLRRADRLREGDLSETLDEKTGVWV